MTLRIPSDRFEEFGSHVSHNMKQVQVTEQTSKARDVTDQFVDAASRATTLRATQESMQVLLEKATSITDILGVQQELTKLTVDYEAFQARANHLQSQSSLGTWHITIWEQPLDSHDDNKPQDLWGMIIRTVHMAMDDAMLVVSGLSRVVVYVLVLAGLSVIPILLAMILYWLCRSSTSNSKPRTTVH
jgi:Domain of unknown function (DUF4349)